MAFRTVPGLSFSFSRPEHTKPPGMASISTPNPDRARSLPGSSFGMTGRSFTVESSRAFVRRTRAMTPLALRSRSTVSKNQICTTSATSGSKPRAAMAERRSASGTLILSSTLSASVRMLSIRSRSSSVQVGGVVTVSVMPRLSRERTKRSITLVG